MATTKAKRSVHPAQPHRHPVPAKRGPEPRTSTRSSSSRRSHRPAAKVAPFRRLVHFPQAKDKTIEDVEFSTAPGYHNISINFQDKTSLNFSIETGFTLETDYSDWKTGNQRILRQWHPVQNLESRDTIGKA